MEEKKHEKQSADVVLALLAVKPGREISAKNIEKSSMVFDSLGLWSNKILLWKEALMNTKWEDRENKKCYNICCKKPRNDCVGGHVDLSSVDDDDLEILHTMRYNYSIENLKKYGMLVPICKSGLCNNDRENKRNMMMFKDDAIFVVFETRLELYEDSFQSINYSSILQDVSLSKIRELLEKCFDVSKDIEQKWGKATRDPRPREVPAIQINKTGNSLSDLTKMSDEEIECLTKIRKVFTNEKNKIWAKTLRKEKMNSADLKKFSDIRYFFEIRKRLNENIKIDEKDVVSWMNQFDSKVEEEKKENKIKNNMEENSEGDSEQYDEITDKKLQGNDFKRHLETLNNCCWGITRKLIIEQMKSQLGEKFEFDIFTIESNKEGIEDAIEKIKSSAKRVGKCDNGIIGAHRQWQYYKNLGYSNFKALYLSHNLQEAAKQFNIIYEKQLVKSSSKDEKEYEMAKFNFVKSSAGMVWKKQSNKVFDILKNFVAGFFLITFAILSFGTAIVSLNAVLSSDQIIVIFFATTVFSVFITVIEMLMNVYLNLLKYVLTLRQLKIISKPPSDIVNSNSKKDYLEKIQSSIAIEDWLDHRDPDVPRIGIFKDFVVFLVWKDTKGICGMQ
eukprot:NODE_8_length_47770_cov_0.334354.p4 type:complete len:617 gc:universal NODE_8_length_47770_cov_0.334354:20397-18547(-)